MKRRASGLETEYGCAMPDRGGSEPSAPLTAQELMNLARLLPHLPDSGGGGIFLINASRLYV
ncbi:MAG: hypothetical protein ACYS1E_18895, partial [Planctomycetota bacterium]